MMLGLLFGASGHHLLGLAAETPEGVAAIPLSRVYAFSYSRRTDA